MSLYLDYLCKCDAMNLAHVIVRPVVLTEVDK